ncbi:hypothetical protein ABMA27_005244 [Loxostege sticticalis]|uniref:Sec16 Sec23-binding domain-containing protein n=1 Tax=Loxostege sticticalis TaxID=481309 RepID=A0ABR3HMB4_LOXSC
MKLKELKKTVNMSWSPAGAHPAMLAAGSAAQQVDSSFSSSSQLELYALNLDDPGLDLELKSSLTTQHKFQKLVWSDAGMIVGGCDGGLLEFYSADKLLSNASDALVASSNKHNGHVSALDINPYQKNLLASGASESEIFIWDLNNTSQPMAPGNRSQPPDHVQGLAWNQQVQHILGSTFATRCVVWDLRKNEPIMKLSDATSRTRWRSLAWHPAVATQLCIASEDDQAPVIQLWDLRLAASPLLTLENHQKGVMTVSWCKQDSDLLLSAGKDGRILCWNPNNTAQPGGELVMEVSQQRQWVFEAAWCPRVPGLLASTSFDQQLAVHSILPTDRPEVTSQSQNNIMESFGGIESFAQLPAVQREPQSVAQAPRQLPQPTRAPAWLRRPVAAKFSFGGKLVTFEKCPQEAGPQKLVYISQVVSEPEVIERAAQLDAALGAGLTYDPQAADHLAEYCRARGDAAAEQHERYTWFFLRANFLPTFRSEILNLLGFKHDEIPSKFKSNAAPGDSAPPDTAALSRGESTETEAELSTDTSTDLSDATTLIERKLANVELGPTVTNVTIPNGEDQTSMICRALICGNLEEAVELCLDADRVADALIIASLGSQELLYKVQKYHLKHTASDPVSLISGSLLQSRWDILVQSASPRNWRDTLAAIVTHCDGEALAHYCEMLGDKLSSESDPSLKEAASICYLCAMSPSPLCALWARRADAAERVLLAGKAAAARGRQLQPGDKLEAVLVEYAWRLAAQGCLQSALNSLEGVSHTALKERLMKALGLLQEHRPVSRQPGQFSRNRTVSSHSQRRGSNYPVHNDTTNSYGGVPNIYEQQQPQAWGSSSVAAASPFPPPQPPRPGSVGPQSGGLTSRSKYKVDPSVQSAPLYNQYSFNSQQAQAQGYGGYNSPLPDQYSAASVPNPGFAPANNPVNPINPPPLNPVNPPLNPINTAPLNSMNQAPLNPMNPAPLNPLNPAPLNPLNSAPLNPLNPAPLNPANPGNQAVNGGYYQEPAPPVKPAAPGWNDPPMLTSKPKPKQEVQAQAPITHPLFGVEPPQHIPLAQQQYPGQPQYPSQQQYPGQQQAQVYPGQQQSQMYPGQQQSQMYPEQQPQQFPGQQYPGQQGMQYPDHMNPAFQQGRESPAVQQAVAAVPPPVKQPIPEQYMGMVNVFDSLRNECYNRANNPQMKRKLEDVQKRLETLYDMLREHRLSENALSTLQTCASLAARADTEGAAHAVTSLAAGAEFAAVASFLPALKGLLQLAQHLQVQLQ